MAEKKPQKEDTDAGKNRLAKKIVGALDLPGEIILNLPTISLKGNEEMEIENYKGIVEYSDERVRINTKCGTLKLEGRRLLLKRVTAESILILGKIDKIEFIL